MSDKTKNIKENIEQRFVSHQDIINDADSTGFIMFNDKAINKKAVA